MDDRTKTGNVLIDAWIDALTIKPGSLFGATAASTTAEKGGTPSPFAWERMFLGNSVGLPVEGFTSAFGATAHLAERWSELAQRSFGAIAALGTTTNAGDPLGKALEQSFGVLGDVGGATVEVPALLAEVTKAASVLCAARETYRAFMLATWQRAFEEVTREAVRRASEGKPAVTAAEWLSLSNEVADRVFVQAFHSAAYIDVQRQLSSALADQHRSEAKLVETYARFGHFPTRRDLDDVTEELSELRRRIRRLERASRVAPVRRRKSKAVDDR